MVSPLDTWAGMEDVSCVPRLCPSHPRLPSGQRAPFPRQIRKKRPIIHPNEGFLLALAKYELELFNCSSVAATTNPTWNFYKWNAMKGKVAHYRPPHAECCCTVQ